MAGKSEFAKAIDVTFSIGLDTKMGDRIEYDEDGDPYTVGETTFADIIAEKAAVIVANAYREQIAQSPSYKFDPLKIAQEAIDAKVSELVTHTLERVVQQTDEFGTTKGEPKTIAELLSARVENWLRTPLKTDSYGRSQGATNLESLLSAVIGRDTNDAITKATRAARDEVLAGLQAKQKEHLEAAVAQLLKSA